MRLEAYRYLEQVGDRCRPIHWCAVKADTIRLIYRSPSEHLVTETDGTLATTRWQMQTTDGQAGLCAVRQGDEILIEGSQNGQKIEARVKIDGAPWFQALSLNLRRFVGSDARRMEFWTLRSDTLSVHKIVAEKGPLEDIVFGGKAHRARIVELRLSGPLSAFWKSRYWFSVDDGVFLKFKGPSGPPGSPDLQISYQGLAEPCDPHAVGIDPASPLPCKRPLPEGQTPQAPASLPSPDARR
jgi:hypothetical protein